MRVVSENTCFIQRTADKALLGLDGVWYPLTNCRANLDKLCKFDNESAVQKVEACPCAARAISETVARGYLGLKSPSWDKFWEAALRRMKKCVYYTGNGTNGVSQGNGVKAPDNRADEPELKRAPDVPREVTYGKLVHADPVVITESFDTPLIRETMDVLTRLSALSIEWLSLAYNFDTRINKIERALGDELHFAEFMNLGLDEGNRCYQRIHQLRMDRRKLKNERSLVGIINEVMQSPALTFAALHTRLEQIRTGFERLQERTYVIRERWPYEDDQVNLST